MQGAWADLTRAGYWWMLTLRIGAEIQATKNEQTGCNKSKFRGCFRCKQPVCATVYAGGFFVAGG
jgi:hypothetical protein